jgi:hypothetical protein
MAANDKSIPTLPTTESRLAMAPCHVPGYRSPEYEHAFDELWALACQGAVSVEHVRQEMLQLRRQFVIGTRRSEIGTRPAHHGPAGLADATSEQRRSELNPGLVAAGVR